MNEDYHKAHEDKARSGGWVPFEEWEGPPEQWVAAPEFNLRGELMTRIKKQTREIRGLQQTIQEKGEALTELGKHNRKIAEVEYKRALATLKAQKREAKETGDIDAEMEVDEQLANLRETAKQAPAPEDRPRNETLNPRIMEIRDAFSEWSSEDRNQWFHSDAVKRGHALAIGDQLLAEDPNMDVDVLFNRIEKEIHSMGANSRSKPAAGSSVDDPDDTAPRGGRSPSKGSKKKWSAGMLNDEQRRIADTYAKDGVFQNEEGTLTHKQMVEAYAQQLGELGELD